MSFGNVTETDILNKLFNDVDFPFDAIGNLYLALHTADPDETGVQTTSEAAYTSYARVAVLRAAGGWTVNNATVSNTALVQFPQCTGSSSLVTHVSIGTLASGAGQIIASGALNSPLTISNLIQPQFGAGALTFTVD